MNYWAVLLAAVSSFGINHQSAQRSFKLWLIDGGYHVAQFAVFGLVLGLWHRLAHPRFL